METQVSVREITKKKGRQLDFSLKGRQVDLMSYTGGTRDD